MLVHHSGKDTSRGARGASSLRSAIDTEIELTLDEDEGVRTALIQNNATWKQAASLNLS